MHGISFVIRSALSQVEKSLNELIAEDIDYCFCGYRIIVRFSGKDENVRLIMAEILDNDWIPDEQATAQFSEQVETMVAYRNREFRERLKQSLGIQSDRIR